MSLLNLVHDWVHIERPQPEAVVISARQTSLYSRSRQLGQKLRNAEDGGDHGGMPDRNCKMDRNALGHGGATDVLPSNGHRFVYIANQGTDAQPDSTVSIIDTQRYAVVKTLTTGGVPTRSLSAMTADACSLPTPSRARCP